MAGMQLKEEAGNTSEMPIYIGKALVVDDEATNRLVLNALLGQMGFSVVEAEDGLQALDKFTQESPDIVFMDIMMPGLDGYQATARIKAMCGDRFVPVIVLTAVSDENALSKCIEVGGDDLLSKPFEAEHLKTKIRAMMRIRDLHARVETMYLQMQQEEELAEKLFNRAVTSKNIDIEEVRMLLRPAGLFSGDTVLTAHGPNGDLHVLLGDFTGHGLQAAIGALPAAEVFRAMIEKGFHGREVMAAINAKLCEMLPDSMFMAACYLYLPRDMSFVSIFNCGLPEVLVMDGETGGIKHRVASHHFALGLDETFPSVDEFGRLRLSLGDRLLIYSDGVIESRSRNGEEYGDERLQALIEKHANAATLFDSLVADLEAFSSDCPQHDDITLVEVPFAEEVLGAWVHGATPESGKIIEVSEGDDQALDSYQTGLTVHGRRLAQVEMVPLIMNELQQNHLPQEVLSEAYTILTELHSNALDHGVLALDSCMKEKEEGFMAYFAERERRLASIQHGYIGIDLQVFWFANGGRIVIRVEDSGSGFQINEVQAVGLDNLAAHGRGIGLVRELCHSLEYKFPGNKVEAVYTWVN